MQLHGRTAMAAESGGFVPVQQFACFACQLVEWGWKQLEAAAQRHHLPFALSGRCGELCREAGGFRQWWQGLKPLPGLERDGWLAALGHSAVGCEQQLVLEEQEIVVHGYEAWSRPFVP